MDCILNKRLHMRALLMFLFPMLLLADTHANAEIYGSWTLLPPLLAIGLAFITKNVILSLFIGVFSGGYLLALNNNSAISSFMSAFGDIAIRIVNSMADKWNAGIMLQVLCIGGLIALITKMGGTKAMAIWLSKKSKNRCSVQISTWLMGLFVFFDDYANSLIVGPIMRPVTDKFKISREKLAFIIDSTAAPVTGIAVVSTWVGLEISLIKDAYSIIGITNINAFSIFIQTLPYRFYNIFMLFFVFCIAYFGRDFGPMLKAERKAKQGLIDSKEYKIANIDDQTLEAKSGIELKISNALVPVLILMIGSFVGFYINGLSALEGEILQKVKDAPFSLLAFRETFGAADASIVLFQAALFASIVAIFMGIYRKIFSIQEAIDTWIKGWQSMIITIVILLLAWSLSSVIKELGTSAYLVMVLSDHTPNFILPVFIFILGSFISFSTGTSYGTMGILMPLAVPLAAGIGNASGFENEILHGYMILNISAVLTGAIFGDHCSPISDTSILSSMGSNCDLIKHITTQFPYAITICIISIFSYIITALGLNVWITLALGSLSVILIVRFVGKKA